MYSIIFAVHDNSLPVPGNYELSRRFILFDAGDTDVAIQEANPLRVTSTTVNTTYTWQIDVAEPGPTTVTLLWMGHFINEKHHTMGLLKPIGNYTEPIKYGKTCTKNFRGRYYFFLKSYAFGFLSDLLIFTFSQNQVFSECGRLRLF